MKIKIIGKGARPKRAFDNDAGADVYTIHSFVVSPGETITVPLGFGLELPIGTAGFIYPRSSLAKAGVVCQLPPIDASYRGEIHAIITNYSNAPYHFMSNDRIGQLVILPIIIPEFVSDLDDARGLGAFGSTGR